MVVVAELNSLDRTNNVARGGSWPPVKGLGLFLWTGARCSDTPIGYEVLQGNYGEGNYTEGAALSLGVQSPMFCPVGLNSPDYRTFKPLGGVTTTGAWSGSWFGGIGVYGGISCPDPDVNPNPRNYCPLIFVSFAPGPYTVVAGDEWGKVVILHFTVQG